MCEEKHEEDAFSGMEPESIALMFNTFQNEMPVLPNYGKVMTGGCHGFAKGVMSWPQDLIIGGVSAKNGTIVSAEALQSVLLVASASDVYNRFKVNLQTLIGLNWGANSHRLS